jgi:hypothetical protein
MRIAILIEGNTENAFLPHLRAFLSKRLVGRMPKLDRVPHQGRIPIGKNLRLEVERLLSDRKSPADAVIALTDVYTGTNPPDFKNAAEAKRKMREWVGKNDKFHPHAAQYEFEAWLIPYWDKIQKLAGSKLRCPSSSPEQINHQRPPSKILQEMYRTGSRVKPYSKILDTERILKGQDLLISANACPELKAFLNTILRLCGGDIIP